MHALGGHRRAGTFTVTEVVSRTGRPQSPRVPDDLPLFAGTIAAADDDLVQLSVQGDFSGQRVAGMALAEAHIFHAAFVGSDLGRVRLVDVLVEGADFSGADLEEASLSRVEFVDCRMSGAQIARTAMHDVSFTECKLDGANFPNERSRSHPVRSREPARCGVLGRSTQSACFFDCDLSGADFSQVVMPEARFHGSSLADIKGGEYMRDVVIESSQVLPLALRVFAGLGIRIEDEREIRGPRDPGA